MFHIQIWIWKKQKYGTIKTLILLAVLGAVAYYFTDTTGFSTLASTVMEKLSIIIGTILKD